MFARLVTAQIQPGKWDEVIAIFHDAVLPDAKRQPGFKGFLALNDPGSGKGAAIFFWETEAGFQAVEASGLVRQQLGRIAGVVAAPPVIGTLEVSLAELPVLT